ncbi:hypothetical protein IHQ71_30260 (plasmid) [Rhizobium sp. TH2]|uniref:hypothetical protein n=1 Tax=Rhizobium sp. TH2 TaxID=2775403 RepID=UPI00215862E0|nr:hypothetical protein [Rhizobium sp. TH2]UVC12523.1 hypothetical protein IHQ71_30260 [Rhizobium sp. TH2]
MEVVGKQVHKEPSGDMTVEFVGEGGDVVSVHIKHTEDDNLTKSNAEDRAKVMLLHVAAADLPDYPCESADPAVSNTNVSPAVASLERERAQRPEATDRDQLDEGLEETFPASDPVSTVTTTIPGGGPINGGKSDPSD